MIKCYSELIRLSSFEDRFNYIKLYRPIGDANSAMMRYLSQRLYESREWKKRRRDIIMRDDGCDLGVNGYDIYGGIIVHHINPLSLEDLIEGKSCIFDFENLITLSDTTHSAVHYGNSNILYEFSITERMKGDTCPWKTPN